MPQDVATPSTPVYPFADAENRAGSRFGDFELLARIGDGGMGAVYVARPVKRSVIERLYALKIPHAYMIEAVEGCAMMLLDEARIARAVERYAHSQIGSIKGRMAYMAPERISGGVADARADVFSYGVVLWEMLAKKRLFRASNDYNTARRVLELDVPKLAGLDPELASFDAVITKAMARRPCDRYPTADALLEAVEEVALATTGIATARAVERAIVPLLRTRIEMQRAAIRAAASRFGGGPEGAALDDDESLDEPTIVEWRGAPTALATL